MSPRGGARKGAGAPKKGPEDKRIQVTLRITPQHLAYLDGLAEEIGLSRSRALESVLERAAIDTRMPERRVCPGRIEQSALAEEVGAYAAPANKSRTLGPRGTINDGDTNLDELLSFYSQSQEFSEEVFPQIPEMDNSLDFIGPEAGDDPLYFG